VSVVIEMPVMSMTGKSSVAMMINFLGVAHCKKEIFCILYEEEKCFNFLERQPITNSKNNVKTETRYLCEKLKQILNNRV
tara:strand:+ start:395 stop:634 length:240 start_codon:yes stop_codon:yes gene_type:complete